MADVFVKCPLCQTKLKASASSSSVGNKAKCPKCTTIFTLTCSESSPNTAPGTEAPTEPDKKQRPHGTDGIPLDWVPGDVILDLYEVVNLPGTKYGYAEGGMGRVNLVRHRDWQKNLAVKSVLPAYSASARDIENFKTEAEQWVDKIGLHPNIVACHYVRVLGGMPRVFIEFVDGGSLADWIHSGRLYEGEHAAALACIIDVAIQFAWGLHYVHELGLIHQDVKPHNVMMTADGVAKVTDFGLAGARSAIVMDHDQQATEHTIRATWGGMTQAYCSPEQADIMAKMRTGISCGEWPKLTRRTDLWSWAVSVLEMFLGERPWGNQGQLAFLHLETQANDERIPPMPAAVRDLLRDCGRRRPEDRPHDLMRVADALQTIYQGVTGQPHLREKPKPDELLADSFNNRGVSLFDLEKTVEAEQKWQEALKIDPCHPEATYNQGLIQWRSAQMIGPKLLQKLRAVRASSSVVSTRVDYLMGLVDMECGDALTALHLLRDSGHTGAIHLQKGGDKMGAGLVGFPSVMAMKQWAAIGSAELPPYLFKGHTSSVRSVSWRCDGRYALSGGHDRALLLWEASSGKYIYVFTGHESTVASAAWSPDGYFALSSGSYDKTLRLWEIASGKCVRTFEGHTDFVDSVSWSTDGRLALSGSGDNTLRLWEISSGRCLRTFEGHTKSVMSVSWSPDGRFVLSGSIDNTLKLWEVASGKCLHTFEGHESGVKSVSWSPDGRFVLSASNDQTLRLWEVSTNLCLRIFRGHTKQVQSVSWSPDGYYALSGSWDKTLRLWEISSGNCLHTFEGHDEEVNSVAWNPTNPNFALSGSSDKTIRLWRIAAFKCRSPLVTSMASTANTNLYPRLLQQVQNSLPGDPITAADILKQARQQPGCSRREDALLLAGVLSQRLSHRGFVQGWQKRSFKGHAGIVNSVSWSPDGCFILSGCDDKTLRLWEQSSGKCLRTFEGHTKSVNSVSWSPDGRFALSGSADETLRVWDISNGECLRIIEGDWRDTSTHTYEGHTKPINVALWSPDGRFTLSASDDRTLRLWEISSGKCLRSFKGHTKEVRSASWSPDGRFVLSGSADETMRLWEIASARCLRTFEGHTSSVCWSPDGRSVLSGNGTTLRLWEISDGKCLRTFEGHTGSVRSVAWSPDGRYVLSGSNDKTLRLWQMSDGKCLRTFEEHTHYVTCVSWSANGRFALSGSWDKTLQLWELDWEFESNQPADWDEGARPFLNAFLTLHTPYVDDLVRQGKPIWTEDDFRRLNDKLGCAGYGWLRPEGVRRELEKMAATWQDPPPLT